MSLSQKQKDILRGIIRGFPIHPSGGGGTTLPPYVAGKFLYTDGSVLSWSSPAGAGDVVGPSSATDLAIALFDSTTGKLIKNSLATIDATGNINIPSGQKYKINTTALAYGDITNAVGTSDSRLSDARTPTAHKTSHQLAGSDELQIDWSKLLSVPSSFAPSAHQLDTATYHTVSGLTGGHFLKALSPTTFGFAAHGLGYADVGAASTTDSRLSDARTPTAHKTSHQKSGSDEISVTDLTGLLATAQTPIAHVLDSAYHTVAGLTGGHFLKALSPTTFGFAAHGLGYADVGAEVSGAAATHSALTTGVHGVGTGTVAKVGDIATDANLSSAAQAAITASHAAVTLAAEVDAILSLSTQQITLDNQLANLILAGPVSGGAAKPTFRSLVAADIPSLAASIITSGTFDGDLLPAISATKKGGVPATGTPAGKYLKDDGTWATVSGSGDVVGPASATDLAAAIFDGVTGKLIKNSLLTIDATGNVNIPSGQKYKINTVALAATDVGAEASGAVATHAALTTGIHGVGAGTIAKVGDIATDANLSSAAQAAITASHARSHAMAGASDHSDWPSGLDVTELGYVNGVTSAIQTQLNAKSASKLREIEITLLATQGDSTSATSYVPADARFGWLYTAASWDSVTFYFEGIFKIDVGTNIAYMQLYDFTSSAAVSGSEITTQSTAIVRVRSSAITFTDGHLIGMQRKVNAGTWSGYIARIIAVQSG